MKNKMILVGGFHEIFELIEKMDLKIEGVIDNSLKDSIKGYRVIGNDSDMARLYTKYLEQPLLITPDKPSIRKKLYRYYAKLGFSFSSLISDEARISPSASIGQGTIIQSGVMISSESRIGRFVKLNYNSTIAHNVYLGDFTTVAPGAVLLGKVNIGANCYIGANATVLPGINICDNTIIGAGAVLTTDITVQGTYAGIPARSIN